MKRSTPMKRTAFKRQAKPFKSAEPMPGPMPVVTVMERPRARMAALLCEEVPSPSPKTPGRVDNRIRQSARGEDCTVRIPGVCKAHPDFTIWSHAPLGAAGKGRGIKALDLCGAYCCTACDAVIDGQEPLPPGYSREQAMLDWFHGHMRSLVRARQKGLV